MKSIISSFTFKKHVALGSGVFLLDLTGYRCVLCGAEWKPIDCRNESVYPYGHDGYCPVLERHNTLMMECRFDMARIKNRPTTCPAEGDVWFWLVNERGYSYPESYGSTYKPLNPEDYDF